MVDKSALVPLVLPFAALYALLVSSNRAVDAVALATAGYGLLWALSDSYSAARNLYLKTHLVLTGAAHMLLSRDKSWSIRALPDPAVIAAVPPQDRLVRRIIFIRHGESVWNEVFNKGFGPKFFLRLTLALIRETLMVFRLDSQFFDSGLSEAGLNQAKRLQAALTTQPDSDSALLRGDAPEVRSLLVTSNLRRAFATGVVALAPRFKRNKGEKLLMLSSLQEISRNVDTLSLSPAHDIADLRAMKADIPHMDASLFDLSLNTGNKSLDSSGILRLQSFCDFAFGRNESVIVIAGHSLWFRSFFQVFLPRATVHDAKDKKIVNCGVIAFDLVRAAHPQTGQAIHMIEPDSIKAVYGGFEQKKPKKGSKPKKE